MHQWSEKLADRLHIYDTLYYASSRTLEALYELMAQRFFWQGEDRPPQAWFCFRNYIKEIIDKRAEAIPLDLTAETADASLQDALEGWLDSPVFGDGKTFWQKQQNWYRYNERTGNLVLKLVVEPRQTEAGPRPWVTVSRMETGDMRILFDSERIDEIFGFEFTWEERALNERAEEQVIRIRELISRTSYQRWENEQLVRDDENPWGFVPVVLIPNEEVEGSLLGRSGIEDLIEPQLMINRVLTDIRILNMFHSRPLLVGHGVREGSLVYRPGMFIPLLPSGSLTTVGGNVSTAALENELRGYIEELFQRGRVSRKSEEQLRALGNAPSGKALLVLNQDGLQYIEDKIGLYEEGFAELFSKALVMMGHASTLEEASVVVTYPPLSVQDSQHVQHIVNVLLQLNFQGKLDDSAFFELLEQYGYLPYGFSQKSPAGSTTELDGELPTP